MTTPQCVRPDDAQQLCEIIADAAAGQRRLDLRGGGTRADFGAPLQQVTRLDLQAFSGVIDYDAPELVITAGAGTRLCDVQALLDDHRQMLAFEPFDAAPLYQRETGDATLGGMIASATAGPRRLTRGSVRDHLLGFEAVSGRGERFVAGGRVVKNVTGYDLPKLVCGSWGRLVALTQVTLKVLPAPREVQTLLLHGVTPAQAQEVFQEMLGTYTALAAAAYLPAAVTGDRAQVIVRLEGFAPSVAESGAQLLAQVRSMHAAACEVTEAGDSVWQQVQTAALLPADASLWKICLPASAAVPLAQALDAAGATWYWDWAGGLTWVSTTLPAAEIRTMAERADGHATLVRGAEAMRAGTATLHPPSAAVARLEEKVRRAFDPAGVFETGRFGAWQHEN